MLYYIIPYSVILYTSYFEILYYMNKYIKYFQLRKEIAWNASSYRGTELAVRSANRKAEMEVGVSQYRHNI